jgi:2-phosphosulfolactate phosphatase
MNIQYLTLDSCAEYAAGATVVIDVLRAFTTAACAFAVGAQKIYMVGAVEEAFALRVKIPGLLLVGEVDGLPISGFDFGNSPSAVLAHDLTGREMVMRTTAGTQGITLSRQADPLFGSSFVCAAATARNLAGLQPQSVSFIVTGARPDDTGDEDAACAEYIAALLRGEAPSPGDYLARVRGSMHAQVFLDQAMPEFPEADLDIACDLDRFPFTMKVRQEEGKLILEKVLPEDLKRGNIYAC